MTYKRERQSQRNIVVSKNDCKPKDCYDLKCLGISTGNDGPHTIYPGTADLPQLQVSCDQETDGGGWIIYQRRLDGSVNFTRNWDDVPIVASLWKYRMRTMG